MKRVILAILAASLVFAAYEYLQAPQFWTRYVRGFLSGGQGAYSSVFDFREQVSGASRPFEIPAAADPVIAPAARDAMIEYAIAYDSFALLVVHNDELQLEWYRDDYDRYSLTQSQSMHKSLQALLVGIAVDEGRIRSIDDPIAGYIGELMGTPKGESTIREYLSMSSGLRPFASGFSPWGEAFRWLYASDINGATLDIPRTNTGKAAFHYNDANTQTLGILLSRVFGRRYAQYLSEKVWVPLGAENAFVWLDSENGVAHHNCCLLATARDWAKIGMLFANGGALNGHRFVSEKWIRQQTSPATIPHYGFQTWIATDESKYPLKGTGLRQDQAWLSDDVFFFSGYGGQRVYVSPKNDLIVVRLGPAAGYFPKIAEEWDNAFLFNTALRGLEGLSAHPAQTP